MKGSKVLLVIALGGAAAFVFSLVVLFLGATSFTVAGAHAGAALLVLAAVSRVRGRPSVSTVCAMALLTTVPFSMLAAAFTLTEPFIVSRWRCGTGLVGLIVLAPVFLAGLSAPGAGVGWLAGRAKHPVLTEILRVATGGAAVLAIVLAGFLVAGALARSDLPSPAEWLESLPTLGELPAPAFDCTGTTCASSKETFEVGGYLFDRRCTSSGGCELRLEAARDAGQWVETGAHGAVRLDDREGLLIVGRNAAFDLRDGGRVVDVSPNRVAASVAPPRPWQWAGVAGLCFAFFAAIAAMREGRRRGRLAAARDGRIEDGVLVFEDDAHPRRARALDAVTDGAVLALPTGVASPPSYRDAGEGPPWRVFPGRRADILAQSRSAELASWIVALASALVATAPLFVAWLQGLLF